MSTAKVVSVSSSYSALWGDHVLASGSVTITLPRASWGLAPITVKNTGSGAVIVTRSGAATIDGAVSLPLSTGESTHLVADGTNWRIIGSSPPEDPTYVLQFNGGVASHVNHGPFWPVGSNLGKFYWDAWCVMGDGYLISEGRGGGHSLLWGGLRDGDVVRATGNIWDGDVPVITFGSDDYTADGEWAYHGVGWDQSNIYYIIDGILTGVVAYSGDRQAQAGELFVGGSHHQNFDGQLAQLRGFENALPTAPGRTLRHGFVPQRFFTTTAGDSLTEPTVASFLANYMVPGQYLIPDLSDGYNGRQHPGAVNSGPNLPGYFSISEGAFDAVAQVAGRPEWVSSATAPFDALISRWSSGKILTVPSPPTGSPLSWDSFNRAKQSLSLLNPTLGSTNGGSLGALVWQYGHQSGGTNRSLWGIINGAAVSLMGGAARHAAWVPLGTANQDLRVRRREWAQYGTQDTGLAIRVQDASNLYTVCTEGGPITGTSVLVSKNIGGTITPLQTFSCPATAWKDLRAVFNGTTLTIYTGIDDTWTQIGQLTGLTDLSSASGGGIANYASSPHTAARYDDWRAYAA